MKEKSTRFAIRIINLYKYLRDCKKETILSKQLLRSGTSIGANIREAVYAESHLDFIHKYSISLKECSETEYWLYLLQQTEYISDEEYESINTDCLEILKLLTATIVRLKKQWERPIIFITYYLLLIMKIVVLDGFAANPGDLSWEGLKALGECTIYDRTAPEEVLERATGAEVILTNKVIINTDHMAALPELKYIGVLATGYNIVDTTAAKERGIIVTNIPAYSTASVAQMVFAHILNICQQVQHHSEEVHKGRWTNNKDFCFWDTPLIELRDKKIGLVGLGNTGYTTARVAIGFGMQVYALTSKSHFQLPPEIKKMDLDQLFSECDIISLHCPLTPETHELVNARRLAMMKPNAILINTGRGPLINEQDLADALNSGKIYAAGVDVLSSEPPRADNPLLTAKNCYITPHIAWASTEARERLMNIAISNLQAYISGTPENVVNK